MLIGSFNIRGLGSRFKHNKVREFIVSKSLEFIMIQETKISEFFPILGKWWWAPFYLV